MLIVLLISWKNISRLWRVRFPPAVTCPAGINSGSLLSVANIGNPANSFRRALYMVWVVEVSYCFSGEGKKVRFSKVDRTTST